LLQILLTGMLIVTFAETPVRRSLAQRKILGIAKWRSVAEELQADGNAGCDNSGEIVRCSDQPFFSTYNVCPEFLQ
jgi:hypothetical protein